MDKDSFFSQAAAAAVAVEVPGLGKLFVRELSLGERMEVERAAAADGAPSRPALLAVAAAINEDGTKFFAAGDAARLDKMPASRVAPLTTKVGEINALDKASLDEAKKKLLDRGSLSDENLLHEVAGFIGCTIEELGRRMGSREWTRWKAWAAVRPFGEAGADLRAGIVAAAMANQFSVRKRPPMDFMPVIRRLNARMEAASSKPEIPIEQLKAKSAAFGKIIRPARKKK